MSRYVQIFPWYRDLFFAGDAGNDDFKYARVFGMLKRLQDYYNAHAVKECRGLSVMKLGANRPGAYCNKPLCPACWHRRQQDVLRGLANIPKHRYYYIRETDWKLYRDPIHPRCIKRFKGHGSRYKMAAYTLNFQAPERSITPRAVKYDVFGGEMAYSLRGVFVSDKLIADDDFADIPNRVQVRRVHDDPTTDVVGIIDREVFTSKDELLDAWLSRHNHPFLYRRHHLFGEYIRFFESNNPVGRSWTRVRTSW